MVSVRKACDVLHQTSRCAEIQVLRYGHRQLTAAKKHAFRACISLAHAPRSTCKRRQQRHCSHASRR